MSEALRGLKKRAGVQMAYVLLFAGFVLWPNMASAPSVLLVAALVLAAVWLIGCLGLVAGVPRSDELMLCGAASPLLVGLVQMIWRLNFLRLEGSFARSGAPPGSATVFFLVWVAEMVLILLPGALFLWWNARSLSAVPPPQDNRPSATSKRT